MASNRATLVDSDGEYPDWIEIHNPTDAAIGLHGWSLTDDPNRLEQWTFPDAEIAASGYQVVFASGKDRRDAQGEWHTNFRLKASGEFLAPDALQRTSDLPIVALENYGGGRPEKRQFHAMAIFEPDAVTGRASLARTPDLQTRAGVKVRGSSTAGREKASFSVEAWDAQQNDIDIAPLGLPADSDWILYAPFDNDRAMLRNAFIYAMSNQMGRYAVRTRFVELYHNTDGGDLSAEDYRGVYVLMEKIKRGPNRVDIEPLRPEDQQEPEISGGWILKIDRADPGDIGFTAAGQQIRYVDPKEDEVTPVQAAWIKNEFDAMAAALGNTDPDTGYAKWIDVDSWIDHHLLNVLAKNVDGLRLSTFFFQNRGGKIEMGPIWDFDRSMGSEDSRDDDPETWDGTSDATHFFDYPWWHELFQDAGFRQKWIDRWFELRRDVFTDANFAHVIDSMADQLAESQVRNLARWPSARPNGGPFAPADMDNWEGELI